MLLDRLLAQIEDLSGRERQLNADIRKTIRYLSPDDLERLLSAVDGAANGSAFGIVLAEQQKRKSIATA